MGAALDPAHDDRGSTRRPAALTGTYVAAALATVAAVVTLVSFGGWLQPRTPELFPFTASPSEPVPSEGAPSTREQQLERDLRQAHDQLAEANEEISELKRQLADLQPSPDAPQPTPRGQTAYLNELDPVSGHVDTEPVALGGVDYRNVVRMDLNACEDPDRAEFNVGKRYRRFTAKAGLHDATSDTDDRWRFIVETIGDDGEATAFDEEVPFGEVADVDIPIDGVLRLRLVIEEIGEARIGREGFCSTTSDPATWADPQLHP